MLDGSSGFRELAKDCVCFANGAGGEIRIGIEDGEKQPAEAQRVDASLVDRVRKRLGELTVNVRFSVECRASENGGEYLAVIVFRSTGVASTADGRYLVRIADTCVPVRGDEIGRLYAERPAVPWELLVSAVPASRCSKEQRADLCARLRDSDRVKSSVKEKSDEELLAHYNLCAESNLTQLGVLLIGMPTDRARLGSAPVLQAIKYDERGDKVAKYSWGRSRAFSGRSRRRGMARCARLPRDIRDS